MSQLEDIAKKVREAHDLLASCPDQKNSSVEAARDLLAEVTSLFGSDGSPLDKVHISWAWEDVQSLRPDWGKDTCLEALFSAEGDLTDRSIERGWEVLEVAVDSFGG